MPNDQTQITEKGGLSLVMEMDKPQTNFWRDFWRGFRREFKIVMRSYFVPITWVWRIVRGKKHD